MTDNKSNSIDFKSIPELKRNLIIMGICVVLIYIFNNLVYSYNPYVINDPTVFFWKALKYVYQPDRIAFLTKDFTGCLWAINLFLFMALFGYFSFLLINTIRYKMIVKALINILAILAVFVIILVFPFTFNSIIWINVVKILLLFSIVLLLLNTVRVMSRHYL
jgi:hypothetical protein